MIKRLVALVALALAALAPSIARAAIAVDATGTHATSGSTTSISYTGITVGSGLSNGALVVFVVFGNTSPTGITAVWDSGGTNQSMTLITSASSGGTIAAFGLIAPTAGAKTLLVSWTNSATVGVSAQSYSGVLQTGGTTTWPNATSATGSTSPASVTVTSAVGNQPTAMHRAASGVVSFTAVSGTQIYNTTSGNVNAANFDAGAATTTLTATEQVNASWVSLGFDMVAASAPAVNTFLFLPVGPF